MGYTIPYQEACANYRAFVGVRTNACGFFLTIQGIYAIVWANSKDIIACKAISTLSFLTAFLFIIFYFGWEVMCRNMLISAVALEELETADMLHSTKRPGKNSVDLQPMKKRYENSCKFGRFLKADFLLPLIIIGLSTLTFFNPTVWIFEKHFNSEPLESAMKLQYRIEDMRTDIENIKSQNNFQKIISLEEKVKKIEQRDLFQNPEE